MDAASPMMKKLANMKSLRAVRLRDLRMCLADLVVDDVKGRRERVQPPATPRRMLELPA